MLLNLFWTGQLIAALAGYCLVHRVNASTRLLWAIIPWVGITVFSLLAITALEAPYSPWDVVRLAPSAGLVRGLPLYSTRVSGAILSTMYTPFSAVAYVPAALFRDPAVAAVVARILAYVYYFLPVYLVCCHLESEPKTDRVVGVAIFLLAALVTLISPALGYSATQIHSDAPALGTAGLTCWLTMRDPTGRWRTMLLASGFAWLSVWAKQTMIAVPLVLPLWWWGSAGLRAGLRSAFATGMTAVLIGAVFLSAWGGDALYFNAVAWPGHLPWKGDTPGNLVTIGLELLPHLVPFAFVIALGALYARMTGDAERRWLCPLVIGLALVPLAILGRVKKGGDLNSFSPALYPLLLACSWRLVWIASRTTDTRCERAARTWKQFIALAMAFLTGLGMATFVGSAKLYEKLRPANAEYAYLRAHPGEVYFPWHPLAHLSAEGRLTHHAHSVWERGVAGYPVGREHALSGIPKDCRYVCFPLKRFGPVVGFSWSLELLQELELVKKRTYPMKLKGLPDYECYPVRR